MDYAQHTGQGFEADWKGILFRRTYKELDEIVWKTKRWFKRFYAGHARFKENDYEWVWNTGESLKLRYLERPSDAEHYQGHEYPWIGWEELTQWATADAFEQIRGCCRSSNPAVPRKIRATANPWGRGHGWVKLMFVDPAPYNTPFIAEGDISRLYIHGHWAENPFLVVNDPEYIKMLESISGEQLRKAWRDGDWDIVAGAFFADVWKRHKHSIPTWEPPAHWVCFRSFDWGSATPLSVGWWTISQGDKAPDGRYYPRGALIRFREWYGASNAQRNEGLRMTSRAVAKEIIEREAKWPRLKVHPGPADPSIWKAEDGPSIAENMDIVYRHLTKQKTGHMWVKADNARRSGWERMRVLMEGVDDTPFFYVMDCCRDFIRTVPILQRDQKDWDDIDTDQEDHAADEARYACMWKGPVLYSARKKYWK